MSDSTIKSNLVGKNGTETITNFATIGDSSTALVGASVTSSGAVSGTNLTGSGKVTAGTYFQIGTHQYVLSDTAATPADVLANATAVDASIANSLVLGNKVLWFIKSNATINQINATALT